MCVCNEIKLHLEVEINGVDQSRLSDIGVDRYLETLVSKYFVLVFYLKG